jgi:hypothetical protein|tara:strand:+ start:71 stop:439 length:369 start_codon:yes stop_codon:yes gene_type:complete
MDITRIPEPITLTAAVAMFQESKKSLEICAMICRMALKEQDTTQMQEHIDMLRDKFLEDIPPGYDTITRREALTLAQGVIGIGGILTIYEELEDTIYTTVEAVVDGTRAAIENFGNFVANNE